MRAAVDLDPEPLEGVGGEEPLRRVLDERVQPGRDRWREEVRAGGSACSALALTSTLAKSVLVTLSAIAAWMRGSEASGLIVRTYRSVFVSWLLIQIAVPAIGASTHAITTRVTASLPCL